MVFGSGSYRTGNRGTLETWSIICWASLQKLRASHRVCLWDGVPHRKKDASDLRTLMTLSSWWWWCLLVDLIKRMLQLNPGQHFKLLEVQQHPFFAHRLPLSFPADTCIDIVNTEQEAPEVSQLPSWYQTAGPEYIHSSVRSTTASQEEHWRGGYPAWDHVDNNSWL